MLLTESVIFCSQGEYENPHEFGRSTTVHM